VNRAHRALESPNLKVVLEELQLASKAINDDIGQQAYKEISKWSEARKKLELKLNQANEAINQEQWAKSEALINQIISKDLSLQPECDELKSYLVQQHYNAIIRDAEVLLKENMFILAFNKANEAIALNTGLPEPRNLKTKIQEKFVLFVKEDIDKALANDIRPQLIQLSEKFENLELSERSAVLKKTVQDRNEADRQLEMAREQIALARQESAIPYLKKASVLWSDNKDITVFHQQTCLHVANSVMEKAKKAIHQNCPLLSLLYCLKAQTVCPQEKVNNQVAILADQALHVADQTSMEFWLSVDIKFDQDVNAIIDTQKLQAEIASSIPQESRFVRVVSPSENIPKNDKFFIVDIDIKDFTVKTEKSMFQKAVRYISYVANDPNPNYIELQAQIAAAQHKMAAAQNSYQEALQVRNRSLQGLSYGGSSMPNLFKVLGAVRATAGTFGMETAKDDLRKANYEYKVIANCMSNTSPTVPRNVYADYQYVVEEYRRSGLLKVITKLINPENQIVVQKLITDTYNKSDQKHDGYSPASLSADPL
ncbi:hypothetical protein KA005_23660, partial [bacterium]|nr:hypothetical protein [bacterium]